MKIKIYLTFLMLCSCCLVHSALFTQVKSMHEILKHFKTADSNTLAIFDVDMVLIQPSEPAFQMPNIKRYSATFKSVL